MKFCRKPLKYFIISNAKKKVLHNFHKLLVVVCAFCPSHAEVVGGEKKSSIVERAFTLIRGVKFTIFVIYLFF